MWDLISNGGWIMVVIAGVSLLGFGLVIERIIVYSRARAKMEHLLPEIEQHIRDGDLSGAREVCDRYRGVVPEVYAMAIDHELQAASTEETEDLNEAVSVYVRTVAVPQLRKFLRLIAPIGRSAPMLGLLGTVFGMITLFATMASEGMGDPGAFTEGVGLALTTTAAGLLVAIPIIYCHSLLLSRVEVVENEIDRYVPRMLQWLRWWRISREDKA